MMKRQPRPCAPCDEMMKSKPRPLTLFDEIMKSKPRPCVLCAAIASLQSRRPCVLWAAIVSLLLLPLFAACGGGSLTSYVNPLVGTGGHGHTFPGAIVPFGQIQPSPDTRLSGWDGCSGYHYSDDTIFGFSHTHLSGTGCEDYGDLLLMPLEQRGPESAAFGPAFRESYKSHFSHRNETARAGYYKVLLDRGNTIVELTANRRVAFHRYTFADDMGNAVAVDLRHRDVLLDGVIRLLDDRTLVGYRHSSSWNPDQRLYFAIRTEDPFFKVIISDDSTQAVLCFADRTKQADLQVAISGVDIAGALGNLAVEGGMDFDEARQAADRTWEAALGKIRVKDGSKEQRRCFYTALYHCMTAPYLWSDVDGRYRGFDGQVHTADPGREVYTVLSLWDTYRALHPLLTEIEPWRTADFVYTAMKQYEQMGELPMWPLAAHETHCMIGYHAVPMILTAYVQLAEPDGTLAGYTPQQLLAAMVATSNRTEAHRDYARQGYLSSEVDNESVSKTLEYAYDDWCIAQMAELAADTAVARTYWLRSQSWQNVLDTNGFAHARRNGGWVTPFDPTEVNNHFTEANSWQYSTYVPHDVDGWVDRLGGEECALAFLDSLFEGRNTMSGRDQADVTGLIGMYAHGNEPSHHAAFLYHLLGRPERTSHYVHRILTELYTSAPDGLCGNEDCGQMSAWYVLASLGLYQVCPGNGQWTLFEPLFHDVETPYFQYEDGNAARVPLVGALPDSLRLTPCPAFADWRMQGTRDRVADTTAQWPGRLPSPSVRHVEVRTPTDKRVTYLTQPAPQYAEDGPQAMVDRLHGTANYRIGGWQGWQEDMVAVVELDRQQPVRHVGVECLEQMRSWIFLPPVVEVEWSADGEQWQPFGRDVNRLHPAVHARQEESNIVTYNVQGHAPNAKFLKVTARNFGPLPDWHVSAGGQAWVFVDEITIANSEITTVSKQ